MKDQHNPSLLNEARDVARGIGNERRRLEALSTVAAAMFEAGEERRAGELFEDALEVARGIVSERYRSLALGDLARAMSEAGLFEEAVDAARGIGNERSRSEALRDLARTMAQAGYYDYPLSLLGPRGLDEFLQALAVWSPSFEELASGLPITVLREATAVAGWVRSDWLKIHRLLSKSKHCN